MKKDKAEYLYSLRENGNIAEFNKEINKLNKLHIVDFLSFAVLECNNKTYWYYITKALEYENK